MGTRPLTLTQKQTLKMLKERGSIATCEVHGNRLLVLQVLRKRNLVKYKDGTYFHHDPPTEEEIDKYVIEHHGKLPIKQITFDMSISTMTLDRIKKRLGLPKLPRGGRKKGDDPRDIIDAQECTPRLPADHSNPSVNDHLKRISNTRL